MILEMSLQFHSEKDITTSIIWGYDQTYPVARIAGIAYEDISSTIRANIASRDFTNKSLCDSVSVMSHFLNSSWLAYYQAAIIQLPSTHTLQCWALHRETSANGLTTYYEYDSFGRLMYIRDNEKNIIKQFNYNYSNN